jgi:hypothetical protein
MTERSMRRSANAVTRDIRRIVLDEAAFQAEGSRR